MYVYTVSIYSHVTCLVPLPSLISNTWGSFYFPGHFSASTIRLSWQCLYLKPLLLVDPWKTHKKTFVISCDSFRCHQLRAQDSEWVHMHTDRITTCTKHVRRNPCRLRITLLGSMFVTHNFNMWQKFAQRILVSQLQ
jgi:hypothetical protein